MFVPADRQEEAARDPASISLDGVEKVALDVTDAAQIEAAAKACGDVTLLINNAGISRGSTFLAGKRSSMGVPRGRTTTP